MPVPRKPKAQIAHRDQHRAESDGPQLEHAILALLAERGPGKTICPSEAARAVGLNSAAAAGRTQNSRKLPASAWRPLMEPAREAARRLVEKRRIVVTQRGRVVDLATAKGPIRLRLR